MTGLDLALSARRRGASSRLLCATEFSKRGTGTMTNTPKIYVADLAAYNAGKLRGVWIDAT